MWHQSHYCYNRDREENQNRDTFTYSLPDLYSRQWYQSSSKSMESLESWWKLLRCFPMSTTYFPQVTQRSGWVDLCLDIRVMWLNILIILEQYFPASSLFHLWDLRCEERDLVLKLHLGHFQYISKIKILLRNTWIAMTNS